MNQLTPKPTGAFFDERTGLVSRVWYRFFASLQSQPSPPSTVTDAAYTVLGTDFSVIANRAGTVTLTLPDPDTPNVGRQLWVRTIQAQAVISASSNVVPRIGGAAGTAILAAADGAWAMLQSDATNWQVMAGS